MELMRNAAAGWRHYIEDGKYAVLLLGVLLYFVFTFRELKNRKQSVFAAYGLMSTVLLLFPVTAAPLMLYQTRFYDYVWLWSLVPVTALTACGGVIFYMSCYEKRWKGQVIKPAALAAMGLGILLLCGKPGGGWEAGDEAGSGFREKAAVILDYLTEDGNNSDICLWAPREILEQVRALDGGVRLLYGRNMWEQPLGAYSYDTYDKELVKLYEWMEGLNQENHGEQPLLEEKEASLCIMTAIDRGVNTVLVPATVDKEIKSELEKAMEDGGVSAMISKEALEGYWIYRWEP